jgi:hypothetical protein
MSWRRLARGRTPTINHEPAAFIQNKRYPINQRATDDVVNRNGASVYQTDQVLICSDRVHGVVQALPRTNSDEEYRVRRCPEKYPLRSSRARLGFASPIGLQRSTARHHPNPP